MTIRKFNRDRFVEKLNTALSTRSPIRDTEHLLGRSLELNLVKEALYEKGCHAFIYGDRGVGKSSLAATVANEFCDGRTKPFHIPCGKDTFFYKTIQELAEKVLLENGDISRKESSHTLDFKIYQYSVTNNGAEIKVPIIDSMFLAVDTLEKIVNLLQKAVVVVIDEFDQIDSATERAHFAYFLKDLGDRGVNVKFIFTGVASSLFELLGEHESSFRQLYTIKLDRLFWEYRTEIAKRAVSEFGIEIDKEVLHSIAKISNGYPYFVHLLTSNLLWVAFNSSDDVDLISDEHFKEAINRSIQGISARLQRPYERATTARSFDHTIALWAMADSESLVRSHVAIFKSYLRLNELIYGREPDEDARPLDQTAFNKIIGKFKTSVYGEIIETYQNRNGFISFKENLLRGFIALKAIDAGIDLRGDESDAPEIPTAFAREKFKGKRGALRADRSDPANIIEYRDTQRKAEKAQ